MKRLLVVEWTTSKDKQSTCKMLVEVLKKATKKLNTKRAYRCLKINPSGISCRGDIGEVLHFIFVLGKNKKIKKQKGLHHSNQLLCVARVANSESFSTEFFLTLLVKVYLICKNTLLQEFQRSPEAALALLALVNSAASKEKGFWRVPGALPLIYNSNVMILGFKRIRPTLIFGWLSKYSKTISSLLSLGS